MNNVNRICAPELLNSCQRSKQKANSQSTSHDGQTLHIDFGVETGTQTKAAHERKNTKKCLKICNNFPVAMEITEETHPLTKHISAYFKKVNIWPSAVFRDVEVTAKSSCSSWHTSVGQFSKLIALKLTLGVRPTLKNIIPQPAAFQHLAGNGPWAAWDRSASSPLRDVNCERLAASRWQACRWPSP